MKAPVLTVLSLVGFCTSFSPLLVTSLSHPTLTNNHATPFGRMQSISGPSLSGAFASSKASRSILNAVQSQKAESVSVRGGEVKSSGTGTATMTSEVFNMVKNIVGAGVLSLPAGVASFGNSPSALLPATLLIILAGLSSAYSFSLIGRVCAMTGAKSYRDAWDKSVGQKTSWIPACATTFKTGVANIAYSMILADTFTSLLKSAGYSVSRTNTLVGLTVTILLPLCLLKDLASLAPFSLLGIIGMGFTAFAMGVRYLGGDYTLPSGKFLADLPANSLPSFGSKGAEAALSPKTFILLSMLSTAYLAHYNAPKYYVELKDNTIKRYNTVVYTAFAISISIFIAIASLGFLTFGQNSQGFILNNFSTKDSLATMCRVAIAISIIFSFPLAFVGAREGTFDLLQVPPSERSATNTKLTIGLLSLFTMIAYKVTDLSFLLSFGGATLGNAIVFLFPALMFRSVVAKQNRDDMKVEAGAVKGLFLAGVLMGGIGAYQAIMGLGGH